MAQRTKAQQQLAMEQEAWRRQRDDERAAHLRSTLGTWQGLDDVADEHGVGVLYRAARDLLAPYLGAVPVAGALGLAATSTGVVRTVARLRPAEAAGCDGLPWSVDLDGLVEALGEAELGAVDREELRLACGPLAAVPGTRWLAGTLTEATLGRLSELLSAAAEEAVARRESAERQALLFAGQMHDDLPDLM